MKVLGLSFCFVAPEGDNFQWYRKEHKEWTAEKFHGHFFN